MRIDSIDSIRSFQKDLFGNEKKEVFCCDCPSISDCLQSASGEFIPLFLKASCVKTLLELILKRNFTHLWKQLKYEIPRFGLVVGLISSVFMMVMCAIKRNLKSRVKRKWAMLLAAFLSALPVVIGMNDKEQNLLKLLLYPLLWRCVFTKLFEMKWLPTFKHGDILAYVISTFYFGHVSVFEVYSNNRPMFYAVANYGSWGLPELMQHNSWNIWWRAEIYKRYWRQN